jgi:L-lactate utilization protein LutC
MADQPVALRLAERIEKCDRCGGTKAVAAELRRLYAENERLHQINQSQETKLSVRAEREKLAHWMWSLGYAIHGDTMEEMLDHLGTQIAERLKADVLMERKQYEHTLALQKASYEREIKIEVEVEREACADICDGIIYHDGKEADRCAAAIRARSKT